MKEERIIVGIACTASCLAMLSVLVTVPQLYAVIGEMHDEVLDGVQVCNPPYSFFLAVL